MNKSYETAELIKEMDPTAEVYGPALWGYTAIRTCNLRPTGIRYAGLMSCSSTIISPK